MYYIINKVPYICIKVLVTKHILVNNSWSSIHNFILSPVYLKSVESNTRTKKLQFLPVRSM